MDDDRKMSGPQEGEKRSPGGDLVERSKLVFLQEIVREFRKGQEQYDLEKEFARTRKNRSFLVPGVTLGLVAVFVVLGFAVTQFIQRASLAIQVDIDDFADVNLREILDEAQRLQNQLAAVQRERDEVIRDRDARIIQLERNRDRAVGLLGDSALTAAQRTARAEELRQEAEVAIQEVRSTTEPRIAELEERIAQLQDALAQYDTRQLEQAREQEEILNNQQRLFELEMSAVRQDYEARIERLTRAYEEEIAELEQFQAEFERTVRARHAEELQRLRGQHAREIADLILLYNPPLENEAVTVLLEQNLPDGQFSAPAPWRPVLGRDGGVNAAVYRQLEEEYAALVALLDRLDEVPYQNGVPAALRQIRRRMELLLSRYEEIWLRLGSAVEQRDQTIVRREATIRAAEQRFRRYQFALEERAWDEGDIGYVLDPRQQNAILVFVSSLRDVQPGMEGFVFRRDNEFIGTIRFTGTGDETLATVVALEDGQSIRPFDRVLIRVQEDE